MTGIDILNKAAFLCGEKADGKNIPHSAVFMINEIGKDLCEFNEIANVLDEIDAPDGALDVMPYGVAMLNSFIEGNAERHAVFCDLYNQKRAAYKSNNTKVKDVLPRDTEGAI